jgi:rSAM/selenodomain-associated transferase 2
MDPAMKVSIVVPTLNEAVELPETLRRMRALPELHEIIVADGGSTDATVGLALAAGANLVRTAPGRGHQLRMGAEAATGDVIVFLHADTWPPADLDEALRKALADPRVVGGGFWKVFRHPTALMRGSRLKCWFRLKLGGLVLGDQGIFVRRAVLERVGGVPDMPLMEEFELCKRLRREGRLVLAPATLVTSERRFRKLGVLRTYARMWRVSLGYYAGQPLDKLRRIYEAP